MLRAVKNLALVREDYRGEVGDARPHGQYLRLDRRIELDSPRPGVRARPDHGHVTLQHVDELRQLVDLETPDETPHLRDPVVVGARRVDTRALGPDDHRTDLDHREFTAAARDPAGHIERRIPVLPPDQQNRDQQDRARDRERDHRDADVEDAFERI